MRRGALLAHICGRRGGGLGLIATPEKSKDAVELADQRRLRCDASDGTLRWWIIGDWRRGRRFPVAPTPANWRREVTALAGLLHRDVQITIGSSQKMP